MQVWKKTLKRVAAGATGLAVLGMTLTGALAQDYTLDHYPTPFTGEDTVLVVGADAASADTTARENIGTSLSTTTTTVVGGGDLTFGEGVYEDPQLGTALNGPTAFGTTGLDDNDNLGLVDGELSISIGTVEGDYDFHEEIAFSASADTHTALSYGDEEFQDAAFIVLPEESMRYSYVFEDALTNGNYFANATSSDDIDLTFLGKALTIRGATTAASITAVVGDKISLNAGDVVKVGENTIKFVKASGSGTSAIALVEINGEAESITQGSTLSDQDVEIYVDSVFDEEDPSQESAVFVVGKEAVKSYNSNNAYWDEDTNHYLWKWNLSGTNTATPTIGVSLAQDFDDVDETLDEDIMALGLTKDDGMYMTEGDYLCLPHKYACLFFEEVIGDTEQSLITIDTNVDKKVYNSTGVTADGASGTEKGIHIKSHIAENKGLIVDGSDTSEAYIFVNGSAWIVAGWDDTDGRFEIDSTPMWHNRNTTEADALTIENGDFTASLYFANANASGIWSINITDDTGLDTNDFWFNGTNASTGFTRIGVLTDDDTVPVIYYGTTSIDSYQYDVMNLAGMIIMDPESNVDNDQVRIKVPNDNEYKIGLRVAMPTGGVDSSATNTNAAYATMLDTDLTDMSGYNVIAIGGPAVNMVSAELLGVDYPAYGADSTIPEGKAILELLPNGENWALVVAGWDAENTLAAASLLANYADSDFGDVSAVTVSGTVAAGVTFE